jgi:putative Mg2+ transporter-C (MgtC) family protein
MDIGNEWGMVDTYLPFHIIMLRLAMAALLGCLIGIERGRHTAEAGMRTHILIALAAALFTILAFEIYHTLEPLNAGQGADPIRAVEAVTAGIAFLGAGAIFRRGAGVHGLTTGAGMWMAGAIGVASALGHYVLAVAATTLAVLVLTILRTLSHKVINAQAKETTDPKVVS